MSPKEFYEMLHLSSRKHYEESDYKLEHPPSLMFLQDDFKIATVICIDLLEQGPKGKQEFFSIHKNSFGVELRPGKKVICSAMVVEAWMSTPEFSDLAKGQFSPSKDPNRIEVLVFSIISATGQDIMNCTIDRENKTLENTEFGTPKSFTVTGDAIIGRRHGETLQ